MFNSWSKAEKTVVIVGGIVAPLALLVGGAVSYGRLQSDVAALQRTVSELKRPVSAKGSLCEKLVDEFGLAVRSGHDENLPAILGQMDQMKCSDFSTETSWMAVPAGDEPALRQSE